MTIRTDKRYYKHFTINLPRSEQIFKMFLGNYSLLEHRGHKLGTRQN